MLNELEVKRMMDGLIRSGANLYKQGMVEGMVITVAIMATAKAVTDFDKIVKFVTSARTINNR